MLEMLGSGEYLQSNILKTKTNANDGKYEHCVNILKQSKACKRYISNFLNFLWVQATFQAPLTLCCHLPNSSLISELAKKDLHNLQPKTGQKGPAKSQTVNTVYSAQCTVYSIQCTAWDVVQRVQCEMGGMPC